VAKIGDLGIASSSNKPLGGSRKYMPPEFYTRKCTQKLDVFTFGLTFNELFNGNHSLISNEKNSIIRIRKEPLFFRDTIYQCVSDDPEERPDSKILKKYLKIMVKSMTFLINEKYPDYAEKNQLEKDEIFKNCYDLILYNVEISDSKIITTFTDYCLFTKYNNL
jgi:serine/threonine protein kinase